MAKKNGKGAMDSRAGTDDPVPPHPFCTAPADPGTFSGETCGLTADESGLCWVHRGYTVKPTEEERR